MNSTIIDTFLTMASSGSTVVEHSPLYLKMVGSSLAVTAGPGIEKMGIKNVFLNLRFYSFIFAMLNKY